MPDVVAQEERSSLFERMFDVGRKLPGYFKRKDPIVEVEQLRTEVARAQLWQRVQNNADVIETYHALLLEMQNAAVRTLSAQKATPEATEYAKSVLMVLEGMRRRIELETQKGIKANEKLVAIAAAQGDNDA